MALPEEVDALTKSFSGFGVDEKSIIAILGRWQPEERKSFRKESPFVFTEDDRLFEKWNADHIALLEREFSRFKDAVVLWTMHPWERDARLAKEALIKENRSIDVLIEIACTRSSEELLGTRKAYHSLFDQSIEEDVASKIHGSDRNLFVALVSAYRYEGSKVNDEVAKSEAKTLYNAIKNADTKNPVEDEELVRRILSTRSIPHLKAIYKHYKEIYAKTLDEDLEDGSSLKEAVMCLCSPQAYFSKVLNDALKSGADEKTKVTLTRVVVTRADSDMKEIKEEYHKENGVSLSEKITETTHGNYKDFLLTLIERGD